MRGVPDLAPLLVERIPEASRAWWSAALARAGTEGLRALTETFPALRRRIGTGGLAAGRLDARPYLVGLDAWRVCDAAGHALLRAAAFPAGATTELFQRGDLEERTIALRATSLAPIGPDTIALLGEIQRTNVVRLVEALVFDGNLVVRALDDGGPSAGFTLADAHRLVLKLAFLDLPVRRAFGLIDRAASPEASRMLEDFAEEREAAGRPVWPDTYRFLGRAPIASSRARLERGLGHERSEIRAAAAEGLEALARG